jgi:hypothetical protein
MDFPMDMHNNQRRNTLQKTNTENKQIFQEKELHAWPQSQFPHSCICDPQIDLPIMLQEGSMWTDPGNI